VKRRLIDTDRLLTEEEGTFDLRELQKKIKGLPVGPDRKRRLILLRLEESKIAVNGLSKCRWMAHRAGERGFPQYFLFKIMHFILNNQLTDQMI